MNAISQDLEGLYASALARLDSIRMTWDAEGHPLLAPGSKGQLVEDLLVKLLRDTERHVAQLADMLERKGVGRSPVGVLRLDGEGNVVAMPGERVPQSRAARLRAQARDRAAKA